MKKLIILNYQRVIPPFMVTEMTIAKDFFDEIIYITPKLNKNFHIEKLGFENINIIQIGRLKWIFNLYRLPKAFLKKEIYKDIRMSIIEKRFNLKFFITYIQKIYAAELLKLESKRIILKDFDNIHQYRVLATWFSVEAYAIAQLKKKYPSLITSALAHSFEVNPKRSKYVDLNLNVMLHKYLDNINFISKIVYKNYKGATRCDLKRIA